MTNLEAADPETSVQSFHSFIFENFVESVKRSFVQSVFMLHLKII